ncbi:MAG: helix-turn-helix transcriptional regulator [Pseudomonadota bacterium]
MDSLIKKDELMLSGHESFLVQAHDQNRAARANGYDYFSATATATTVARLPMLRTYKIPVVKSSGLASGSASGSRLLTLREMEIIGQLGTGLSVKGVARELDIAPGTVKWHVKNIYYKLGASSREDALSKARLRGIIWR